MALVISFRLLQNLAGKFKHFGWFQAGFRSLAESPAKQILTRGEFGFAAAVTALFGHKRAESLLAEDNAFAFQLLVSPLDCDDADQQILGKRPERRQRYAGLQAPFADFACKAIHDLLVKRAVCRRGDRSKEPRMALLCH